MLSFCNPKAPLFQSKALKKTRLGILSTAGAVVILMSSQWMLPHLLFQWRMLLCLESGGIWWNFKMHIASHSSRMQGSKKIRLFNMLSGGKGTVLPSSQKNLGTTYTSPVLLATFWAPQPLPAMVDPVENEAPVAVAAPGTGGLISIWKCWNQILHGWFVQACWYVLKYSSHTWCSYSSWPYGSVWHVFTVRLLASDSCDATSWVWTQGFWGYLASKKLL